MSEQQPEPSTVAGVEVEDVLVDFNLKYSNPPDLKILLADSINLDDFQPVSGDEDDDIWLAEHDGVFYGWTKTLKTSDETVRGYSTTTVEHDEYGTVEDRYSEFHHVVKKRVNRQEPAAAIAPSFSQGFKGSTSSFTMRVEKAQELLNRYVNGPLGSTYASYWYAGREVGGLSWARANTSRDAYDGYAQPDEDVLLVYDSNYTWHPQLKSRIETDQVVFDPDATYYAVIRTTHDSTWGLYTTRAAAEERSRDVCDSLDEPESAYRIEEVTYGGQ